MPDLHPPKEPKRSKGPADTTAVCFIPVRSSSSRASGKNFELVAGRPLYQWIVLHCLGSGAFDAVVIDTNSRVVDEWVDLLRSNGVRGLHVVERDESMLDANGNELLVYHAEKYAPSSSIVCQCFATAPFLRPKSIRMCADLLRHAKDYDSVLTVMRRPGWYWRDGIPLNYRSPELPKSQDAALMEETTGLYAIKTDALRQYGTRIGRTPYFFEVPQEEGIDIDTPTDLLIVQQLAPTLLPYGDVDL